VGGEVNAVNAVFRFPCPVREEDQGER
jgi:hypothetical protein